MGGWLQKAGEGAEISIISLSFRVMETLLSNLIPSVHLHIASFLFLTGYVCWPGPTSQPLLHRTCCLETLLGFFDSMVPALLQQTRRKEQGRIRHKSSRSRAARFLSGYKGHLCIKSSLTFDCWIDFAPRCQGSKPLLCIQLILDCGSDPRKMDDTLAFRLPTFSCCGRAAAHWQPGQQVPDAFLRIPS